MALCLTFQYEPDTLSKQPFHDEHWVTLDHWNGLPVSCIHFCRRNWVPSIVTYLEHPRDSQQCHVQHAMPVILGHHGDWYHLECMKPPLIPGGDVLKKNLSKFSLWYSSSHILPSIVDPNYVFRRHLRPHKLVYICGFSHCQVTMLHVRRPQV